MTRIVKYALLILVAVVVLTYGTDYLVLRYRLARNRSPYGTVTISLYYAIKEKNNKTEYTPPSEQEQTCVNTLFPQMGLAPCWYVRRHKEKMINV
jgi:hypothetical protein